MSVNDLHPDIEKINRVLEQLTDEFTQGYAALLASKHLRLAYNVGGFRGYGLFFTSAYLSCRTIAELTLAKLTLVDKDSINIVYLLNLVDAAAACFPYGPKEVILKDTKAHRAQLAGLDDLLTNLRKHRYQRLAHLDRKLVTDPTQVLEKEPLDTGEVEASYQVLLGTLNKYKHYAANTMFVITNLQAGIAREVEHLFDRLTPLD